jgi:hypothetical protein
MSKEKLDMLKNLFTAAYELEVKCSCEQTPDFEAVLDDEAFEFVRDLVLGHTPTESTQKPNRKGEER